MCRAKDGLRNSPELGGAERTGGRALEGESLEGPVGMCNGGQALKALGLLP